MDLLTMLDPELVAFLLALPREESSSWWDDLPAARIVFEQQLADLNAAILASALVTIEDRTVPGPAGAPAVPIRAYRPINAAGPLPALLWIHGGGMVIGSHLMDDRLLQRIVNEVGCIVVAVEYRLAPEHPFPAPIEDCYAALYWMHAEATAYGIEASRIAVGGGSAGGGLAAGLVLLARDRGQLPVAFQWLIYPMLDDRNRTASSYAITDPRVWNRRDNLNGWRAYLGVDPGSPDVSPHASPARATEFARLPPTYIDVGSHDLFLDEDVDYALRLVRGGISVELHVYPGAFHGSEIFVPDAALSRRMVADRILALKRGLDGSPQHH
jgi:acetyl esterase/lipase